MIKVDRSVAQVMRKQSDDVETNPIQSLASQAYLPLSSFPQSE